MPKLLLGLEKFCPHISDNFHKISPIFTSPWSSSPSMLSQKATAAHLVLLLVPKGYSRLISRIACAEPGEMTVRPLRGSSAASPSHDRPERERSSSSRLSEEPEISALPGPTSRQRYRSDWDVLGGMLGLES